MLPRKRRQPFVERDWRRGTGRVVRIVDPEECRALPGLDRHRIEVGQEAVLLEQRQLDDARTRELRPTDGDGVPGLGEHDRVPATGEVEHDIREREDRLLGAERRDHVHVCIEAAPNRRPTHPVTASRSSGSPTAAG